MFSPEESRDGPDALHLEDSRITLGTFSDGTTVASDDNWRNPLVKTKPLRSDIALWTGTISFSDKPQFPQLLTDDLTTDGTEAKGLPSPPEATEGEQ